MPDDVVRVIDYRLIRPDGTVLWTTRVPNYLMPPLPPISTGSARTQGDFALPPWRYECRDSDGDWLLLAVAP